MSTPTTCPHCGAEEYISKETEFDFVQFQCGSIVPLSDGIISHTAETCLKRQIAALEDELEKAKALLLQAKNALSTCDYVTGADGTSEASFDPFACEKALNAITVALEAKP